MKKLFLDDLENVMEILVCFEKFLTDGASLEDLGFMYCSSCREECRMHIGITHYEKTVLHKQVVFKKLGCRLLEATDEAAFLTYACVNCLRHYWAYFHRTQEDDLALRVLTCPKFSRQLENYEAALTDQYSLSNSSGVLYPSEL
jgi:hypothetical protein